jgi:hypothetical protein
LLDIFPEIIMIKQSDMLCSMFSGLAALLVAAALAGSLSGNETYNPLLVSENKLAMLAWPKYRGDVRNTAQGLGSGATNVLRWSMATGSSDRSI